MVIFIAKSKRHVNIAKKKIEFFFVKLNLVWSTFDFYTEIIRFEGRRYILNGLYIWLSENLLWKPWQHPNEIHKHALLNVQVWFVRIPRNFMKFFFFRICHFVKSNIYLRRIACAHNVFTNYAGQKLNVKPVHACVNVVRLKRYTPVDFRDCMRKIAFSNVHEIECAHDICSGAQKGIKEGSTLVNEWQINIANA